MSSQWSLLPRSTAPRNASRARAADETASGRALRRKAQRCEKTSHNRRQAPAAGVQFLRPRCKVIYSKAKSLASGGRRMQTRLACLSSTCAEAADDCYMHFFGELVHAFTRGRSRLLLQLQREHASKLERTVLFPFARIPNEMFQADQQGRPMLEPDGSKHSRLCNAAKTLTIYQRHGR